MESSKISKSPVVLTEVAANRRYAHDPSRKIKGYLKLECGEDRGLVVLVMDNVKFFPKGEYVYKLLLAGHYRERLRYHMVGNVSLSAEGKGEGSYRINPQDLDGRGTALSHLDTAIVAAMSTSCAREPLHPVLKGWFGSGAEGPRPEAASSAGAGRTAEPRGAGSGAPGGGMPGMQEPPGGEAPHRAGVAGSPSMAGAMQVDEAAAYRSAACRELDQSKDHPAIRPFKTDHTGASWRKISDPALFPLDSPDAAALLQQYRHFLLGTTQDHYLIAVPGRCLPEEHPEGGATGFCYWQPILGMENKAPGKETYGYWIAAIDKISGLLEREAPV